MTSTTTRATSRNNNNNSQDDDQSPLDTGNSRLVETMDEETPLNPMGDLREGETMISPHRALMGLLKSMVGPGCLSLAYGWKNGGLWSSFSLSIVISLLNLYCSYQMIRTAQYLCRISNRESLDYGHFAKKVFDHGPSDVLRRKSKTIMYVANAANIFYQIGVCAIQIVFMATNLQQIVETWSGNASFDMRTYATMVLLPVVFVNLIRELRMIAVLATFANFILLFGLIIILQACFSHRPNKMNQVKLAGNFFDTMLFVGTAMYTFEGQAAMLPIENKLRNPAEMTQNCGVLPAAMGFVSAIFIALGFFGYVAFGDDVQPSITLNMPQTAFYRVVNLTLVVAAYIGHVVNLYVVVSMLWPGIKRKAGRRFPSCFPAYEIQFEILFRIFLVLSTYLFAVLVPKLELMIPLIGITAGIMIAFIFPPFFEMLTFWHQWTDPMQTKRAYFHFKFVTNCLIMSVAVFVMVFGFYQNIYLIYVDIYRA